MKASPSKGMSKTVPLQTQRESFINQVIAYRMGSSHDVTVVFDGSKTEEKYSRAENVRGVRVIYSARGETADDVIIMLVRQSSRPSKLLVVSSDREIQRAAKGQGATVASAQELSEKLANPPKIPDLHFDKAAYMERIVKGYEEEENGIGKKKGNAKRPKKDKRRIKL